MRKLRGGAIAIALCAVTTVATAAPCAGFGDVADTDIFCPNVQWLKNRAITLGCDASNYCPGAAITRLQMAAFMNRLGTVLTPRSFVMSRNATGAFDLDTEPVLCEASVEGKVYPLSAQVDGTVSLYADVDVTYAVDLLHRIDGGPWTVLNAHPVRASIVAGQWSAATHLANVDLAPNGNAWFAVRVSRAGSGGSGVVAGISCGLRALVHNRDGTAPPY